MFCGIVILVRAWLAVRQRYMALCEDACGACTAYLGIELGIKRGDCVVFPRKDILLPDVLKVLACCQEFAHGIFHKVEIQPTTHLPSPLRFSHEHLRAGNVDDVNAARHDQQMLLLRISLIGVFAPAS